MSGFGELFATEEVRDFIQEVHPTIKFKSIQHDLEGYNSASTLPEAFEVTLLDEHDVPVATAEVKVKFWVAGGPATTGRYVEAGVEEVAITKVEELSVPYVQSETRHWTCPVCGAGNLTHLEKGYEEPRCGECQAKFKWGVDTDMIIATTK